MARIGPLLGPKLGLAMAGDQSGNPPSLRFRRRPARRDFGGQVGATRAGKRKIIRKERKERREGGFQTANHANHANNDRTSDPGMMAGLLSALIALSAVKFPGLAPRAPSPAPPSKRAESPSY